jgi:hypothetical protein
MGAGRIGKKPRPGDDFQPLRQRGLSRREPGFRLRDPGARLWRNLARDIAKTDAYLTSRRERKKIEMFFAHLKPPARQNAITRLLCHMGPSGLV